MSSKTETTDLVGCGRCGGRHNGLKLKAFTRPILDQTFGMQDVVLYSHYATCPKMGQPILALVVDVPDVSVTEKD